MTGKELKAWSANIPDEAIIEVKGYEWGAIDPEKIRAMILCKLTRTMDNACNVEDAQ